MSVKSKAILVTALILVLFTTSVGVIFYRSSRRQSGAYAYIYQNDKLIRTVELKNVGKPYNITIETEDGGYNVLEVREGSIGIVEASCPDHLCKNMGFISNSLLPVTCLPNHLVIKVADTAGQKDTSMDAVVY
jgi:hypothetical protein